MCDNGCDSTFVQTGSAFLSVAVRDFDSSRVLYDVKTAGSSHSVAIDVEEIPVDEGINLTNSTLELTDDLSPEKTIGALPLSGNRCSSDPESLVKSKKIFYLRTWFTCMVYGLLLVLLIGAIIALAVNRHIVIPNSVMEGEVFPKYGFTAHSITKPNFADSSAKTVPPQVLRTPADKADSVSAEPSLLQVTSANSAGPSLLQLTSATSTGPQSMATTTPLPQAVSSLLSDLSS